ncbi:MAG TPA: DUF6514 family protein [Mobilitalea sp.]|nr:DUF6514 family protein [Mobilitalea sp.]
MNKLQLLFSNEVLLEDARVMKLDYSLTEKASEEEKTPYYGVKITKYLENLIESDEVTGISESKDAVVSIIKKLCQFEVTPISMVEIVDDMVTMGI